ncbi:hypothetical protein TorRG33x02_114850 [Trema orientale]|uniref:Transmembrane protein n=1 Tax=Trema orientale TaxID=63057 RepID=A0A2P5F4B3_TREOI|nr:hypothetical protein TorRG33x02_114850 [Trema orientale]
MVPRTLLTLLLLLLFLGFSYAIPTTRSFWQYSSSLAVHNKVAVKQNWLDLRNGKEVFGEEENENENEDENEGILIQGRMDLESTMDYPGTGANKNHDPKTPGTA